MACGKCSKPVTGQHIEALEKKWHLECFLCMKCGEEVIEEYYEHANLLLCREDYVAMIRTPCAACAQPLTGKKVKALGNEYHPECFVCVVCKKALGVKFFHKDGHLLCADHIAVDTASLPKTSAPAPAQAPAPAVAQANKSPTATTLGAAKSLPPAGPGKTVAPSPTVLLPVSPRGNVARAPAPAPAPTATGVDPAIVMSLQDTIKRLERELLEAKTRIQELEARAASADTKLKSAEAQRQAAEQNAQTASDQIQRLQKFEKEAAELRLRESEAQEALRTQRAALAESSTREKALALQLTHVEARLKSAEATSRAGAAGADAASEEKAFQAELRATRLEEQLMQAKKDSDSAQIRAESFKTRASQFESQLVKIELELEHAAAQAAAATATAKQHEASVAELRKQLQESDAQKKNLQEANAKQQSELEALKKQTASLQLDISSQRDQYELKLKHAQQLQTQAEERAGAHKDGDTEKLQQKIRELETAAHQASLKAAQVDQQLTESNIEKKASAERIALLTTQLSASATALEEAKSELQKILGEKRKTEALYTSVHTELQQLQTNLDGHAKTAAEKTALAATQEARISQLEGELSNVRVELQAAQKDHELKMAHLEKQFSGSRPQSVNISGPSVREEELAKQLKKAEESLVQAELKLSASDSAALSADLKRAQAAEADAIARLKKVESELSSERANLENVEDRCSQLQRTVATMLGEQEEILEKKDKEIQKLTKELAALQTLNLAFKQTVPGGASATMETATISDDDIAEKISTLEAKLKAAERKCREYEAASSTTSGGSVDRQVSELREKLAEALESIADQEQQKLIAESKVKSLTDQLSTQAKLLQNLRGKARKASIRD
eukprot:TRINITY_DN992_c0_g1_i1.p1 TRINITY_DN992_c0_g1~~TRINITY_DN992_c0_g1_i1.p1  ORF type:complete len:859 (-),score=259.20 TRINITY_DN992_c0_g1_i1:26-2602(-)